VAGFAVRVIATLATMRAVDAWVVRLEPPWQVAVAIGIAVDFSPRTE